MNRLYIWMVIFLMFICSACAPLFLGAGAVGAYKVGTDDRSAGRILTDSTITATVKHDLAVDREVKARNIDVDTFKGTVYLSGMVDSKEEASVAVSVAKKVKDVKSVKNNMQVGKRNFSQAFGDSMIASKVKGQIVKEPGVRSLNLDVDVYNGIVYITGSVKNVQQKDSIVKIAEETYGTVSVVDNMDVSKED